MKKYKIARERDEMMNRVDTSMFGYLHTYEAYRVPKGTKVKDASGQEVVLSKEEDVLVLTEKAGKQLVKDRRDYGNMLFFRAEEAARKTQTEATAKFTKDQAKAMAVFRSMSKGANVPSADERKLIEYDPKLYQAAKAAQAMAQMAKERIENKKSEWNAREEREHQVKMNQLRAESEEATLALGKGSVEFSNAQRERIVEIDSTGVDFSSMKTMNLGAGVTGAHINLSI